MQPTTLAVRCDTPELWGNRITETWNRTVADAVAGVVETGRNLIEAKAALPHGGWIRMFEDGLVPMSIQTADKLMAIARHPIISNYAHVRNLPPSWGTLYELSRIPEDRLLAAMEDGSITPEIQRKDVARLLLEKHEADQEQGQDNADWGLSENKPEWFPRDGDGAWGTFLRDWVTVLPSYADDYYWVERVMLSDRPNEGAMAEGTNRPIHWTAIDLLIRQIWSLDPESAEWKYLKWDTPDKGLLFGKESIEEMKARWHADGRRGAA